MEGETEKRQGLGQTKNITDQNSQPGLGSITAFPRGLLCEVLFVSKLLPGRPAWPRLLPLPPHPGQRPPAPAKELTSATDWRAELTQATLSVTEEHWSAAKRYLIEIQ